MTAPAVTLTGSPARAGAVGDVEPTPGQWIDAVIAAALAVRSVVQRVRAVAARIEGEHVAVVMCVLAVLAGLVVVTVQLIADAPRLGLGIGVLLDGAAWTATTVAALWVRHRLATRTERKATKLGGMTMRIDAHEHGGGPASSLQRFIGRHEVGHVRGALRTGMGVHQVHIGDGYGWVEAERFTTVAACITFSAAGHLAVGSKSGAGFDLAQIRRLARMLPAETRKEELHAAIEHARRIVRQDAAIIRREGHRLADTGRW